MDSQTPGGNQRKTFRCRLPEGEQAAELRLGGRTYRAWLMDESAGGFAVAVEGLAGDGHESTVPGGKGVLRTAAGWFEVQAVNFAPLPPRPGRPPNAPRLVRVGLMRLKEIAPPVRGASFLTRLVQPVFPRQTPVVGSFLLVGVALAGIAVAATFALTRSGWRPNWQMTVPKAPFASPSGGWGVSSADRERAFPVESRSAAPGFASREKAAAVRYEETGVGRAKKNTELPAAPRVGLEKLLAKMPGASVFVVPDVAAALQLSDAQREAIRRIDRTAAEAILGLERDAYGGARGKAAARERELLHTARQQALELLTEAQRERWSQMAEGAAKE